MIPSLLVAAALCSALATEQSREALGNSFSSNSAPTSADSDVTFEVTFPASVKRLGLMLNADLTVRAFHRDGSRALAAEQSGRIQVGDVLTDILGGGPGEYIQSLGAASLADTQRMLAEAPSPKTLRFRRPGARVTATRLEALATAPAGIHGHAVNVDVSARGMPMVTLTGMQAMFGGPIKCQKGPVVFAAPVQGCGAYSGADAVRDAILLVERGGCSFAHKAALAQQYNARALIVLNDEPGVLRMPDDPAVRHDTTLPVIMLSEDDANRLHKYASHLSRSGVAVLRLPEQYCGAIEPNAPPAAAPLQAGAMESPPLPAAGIMIVMTEQQVMEMLPVGDTVATMLAQRPEELLWTGALLHLLPHEHVAKLEYFHAEFGEGPSMPPSPLVLREAEQQPEPKGCMPTAGERVGSDRSALLMQRRGCLYGQMAHSAVTRGARAMIVGNNERGLQRMRVSPTDAHFSLTAVMIGQDSHERLCALLRVHGMLLAFLVPDAATEQAWSTLYNLPATIDAAQRRRLAQAHHPDAAGGDHERFLLLQQLFEAFDKQTPTSSKDEL